MKTLFRIFLAAAVATATVVVMRHIRSEQYLLKDSNRRVRDLTDRNSNLEAALVSMKVQVAGLCDSLSQLSNNLERASAQLADEKATNDPLRRQIEGLTAREISLKARLTRQKDDLELARTTLNHRQNELDELRKQKDLLDGQLAGLESSQKDSLAAKKSMTDQIERLKVRRGQLENEEQQLKAKIAEHAASEEKLRNDLNRAVAELEDLKVAGPKTP